MYKQPSVWLTTIPLGWLNDAFDPSPSTAPRFPVPANVETIPIDQKNKCLFYNKLVIIITKY